MRFSQVLFNVTGSSALPVSNLTIRGLEIRDTALTYYGTSQASKHGMPTGGDWALERSGAVLLEGTEFSTISECLFERIDGESLSHPCRIPIRIPIRSGEPLGPLERSFTQDSEPWRT